MNTDRTLHRILSALEAARVGEAVALRMCIDALAEVLEESMYDQPEDVARVVAEYQAKTYRARDSAPPLEKGIPLGQFVRVLREHLPAQVKADEKASVPDQKITVDAAAENKAAATPETPPLSDQREKPR